jgi:hypothetical protein
MVVVLQAAGRAADPLEPFIGVRIKVRCRRCHNVLDVFSPSTSRGPSGPVPSHGAGVEVCRDENGGALESVVDEGPDGRGPWSRPQVSAENANALDWRGQRDWSEPTRWAWTCGYRRCVKQGKGRPARYTVTDTYLEERFLLAARAGLDSFEL